jgi:hypothetical protein
MLVGGYIKMDDLIRRCVSLNEDTMKKAVSRHHELQMSFSAYVRMLIRRDIESAANDKS